MAFIRRKKSPEKKMARDNTSEEILKRKTVDYLNSTVGLRAAIFEKVMYYGRPDIIVATKNKETIVCEVKAAHDTVRRRQLENYLEMSNKVLLIIETSKKLDKHLSNVPEECGIIVVDGDNFNVIRECQDRPGFSRYSSLILGLFSFNDYGKFYKKLTDEQFNKLRWFTTIIYSRFFPNKTDSNDVILMSRQNKKEYSKTYAALSRYCKKFLKRIGIKK